jgi:undecaprenyl-diphosphatase
MHSIDLSILYFFNQTLASPTLDVTFDILTNVRYWYPIYVLTALWLIYKAEDRRTALVFVLGAVALVALTDSLSHYYLKPLFGRARPCSVFPDGRAIIDWIRLPVGRKLDPSMPSNHALNNMAVAVYFVARYGRRASWLAVVAVLIGLGRMYEGVHYPSDVLAGFVMGAAIGYAFEKLVEVLLASRSRAKRQLQRQ